MFPRKGVDLRYVDKRYKEIKDKRKRQVESADDLPEIEKGRWDLDTANRKPTGKKYPPTWQYTGPLERVNETRNRERNDVRRNPRIRDAPDDPFKHGEKDGDRIR